MATVKLLDVYFCSHWSVKSTLSKMTSSCSHCSGSAAKDRYMNVQASQILLKMAISCSHWSGTVAKDHYVSVQASPLCLKWQFLAVIAQVACQRTITGMFRQLYFWLKWQIPAVIAQIVWQRTIT